MGFSYMKEAIKAGDILPSDAILFQIFESPEFQAKVKVAVQDVKRCGYWSDSSFRNYDFVKKSISGSMIEAGFMPLTFLEDDEDPIPLAHTLRAFLGLSPDWEKDDPFVRRWSTSQSN